MDINPKYFFLFSAGILVLGYAIYLYKIRRLNKKSHVFYYHQNQAIPDIEEIGQISQAGKPGTPVKPGSGPLRLHELSKLFKYRENRHTFWVAFMLENDAEEDVRLKLKKTIVNIAGQPIECNLVLSMKAPHASKGLAKNNHYLNTRTHPYFMLGPSADPYLNFQARFVFEGDPAFKTTDTIYIQYELLKQHHISGAYEVIKQDEISAGFHDMRYKHIQMVNEELEYQS